MDNKTKCKICGYVMIGIIISTSYPICKYCSRKLEINPDILSQNISMGIPAKTSFAINSVQVSASASSTTTTPPQGV